METKRTLRKFVEQNKAKLVLKARCIVGHEWDMTAKQIAEARRDGCAMCPTCGNPATVEGAKLQ